MCTRQKGMNAVHEVAFFFSSNFFHLINTQAPSSSLYQYHPAMLKKGLVADSLPNPDPRTWRESIYRICNAIRYPEARGAVRRHYRRKYSQYMFRDFPRHSFMVGLLMAFGVVSYTLANSRTVAILLRLPTDDPNRLMNSPEFLAERNELMMRRAELSKRMENNNGGRQ